jgi:Transposase
LVEAGAVPHLAEPVETSALRGRKRRAKTDREDARWLRTLLREGRLPEAWIPPAHVLEWRTRARLRKTLVDERTSWLQRVQATLFQHGVSGVPDKLLSAEGREFLAGLELPAAASERIEVALRMIEALDQQLAPIEQQLRQLARRQSGCRALMRHYGIGELTAPTILCLTDPDSRNLKTIRGWVQGYNAQAAVTTDQIVVAAEISTESLDTANLRPMVETARKELEAAGIAEPPGVVLADAGYWKNEAIEAIVGR